jgi:hypothetical protein
MGKLTRKILGNVSGKVGDITFSQWKGQTVVKSKVSVSAKKPTEKQELVRQRFRFLSELSRRFSSIIPLGFAGSKDTITVFNSFFRTNQEVLSGSLGNLQIDFSKLVLSRGNLETVTGLNQSQSGSKVLVNWQASMGDPNDKLVQVLVHSETKEILYKDGSRSSLNLSLDFPNSWVGAKVHGFVFLYTESGRSSNSQYIGELTLA